MCGAKPIQTIAKAAVRTSAAVLSGGATEWARNSGSGAARVLNKAESIPENLAGKAGDWAGARLGVNTAIPQVPDVPTPATQDPTPTFTPPNPSETAAISRRRRLAALRMGLLSTVRAGNAPNIADILAPTATAATAATGTKVKLGQ